MVACRRKKDFEKTEVRRKLAADRTRYEKGVQRIGRSVRAQNH